MFPLVKKCNPTFADSTENFNNFVNGSANLLVPGRVTASSTIPQGAMCWAIEPTQLLGHPDIVQISIETNTGGVMELDNSSRKTWCKEIHWVRALRLSDDCHSYNVQLRFHPSQRNGISFNKNLPPPKLILQAVRTIPAGQELLLWFSEHILAMLQIGFLTPANIQGQKKYVCTKCSAMYESPNPLKLHITLSCGRLTVTSLWEKLSNSIRDNSLHNILHQEIFDFKLSPEPQTRQKNAMDLSVSKHLYRPYTSEPSAFKPFKKNQENCAENMMQLWPSAPFEHHNFHLRPFGTEDEAQIETLVSSLGKSQEGHVCLYCGKCYSRKYGLKIHIRTHTGYKPLKCKFCMRPFGDPSNLNKHVRLHAEGNTPYKCDLCGKILVRRRDLDRHLKSRHMIEMHPGLNILQEDSSRDEIMENNDCDLSKS